MASRKDVVEFSALSKAVFEQIGRDIVGLSQVVEQCVIAMVGGGNVLLEGVPGVGKTRLVRSIGRVFGLPFSRIQFTPDLMPADITGTNIIERQSDGTSVYRFQPGPIFSSIVLADEINRATPKTQSALLEAMQEHIVSVGGVDHPVDEPFFVLATQNPIEQDGTYPLPEAQIDRFIFKLLLPFPSAAELKQIVSMTQITMDETAEQVMNAAELLRMRETAREIPILDEIVDYTMDLVASTHPDTENASEAAKRYIRLGASPRAAQALITTAKVRALMHGCYNVSFEDIDELAYPVLRHRLRLNYDAVAARMSPDALIGDILKEARSRTKRRENKVR